MSVFIPNILPICARKESVLVYQFYSLVRARIFGIQKRETDVDSKRLWLRLLKTVCDAPVSSAMLTAIMVAHVVKVLFFPTAPWMSLAVNVPDVKQQLLSADAFLMLIAWAQMVKASLFHHHWLHLLTNAIALFATGLALERRIGSAFFAGLYVASALVGYTLLVLLSAEGYAWGASYFVLRRSYFVLPTGGRS